MVLVPLSWWTPTQERPMPACPATGSSRGRLATLALTAAVVMAAACGEAAPDPEADRTPQLTASPQDPVARQAVVATARTVLEAISTADPDLLRSVMMPEARFVATGRGTPRVSTAEEVAVDIGDPGRGYVERMWDPRVEIDGPIASVWTPYDFYIHGELSHCGVDAFHLVLVEGRWRVQSVIYTVMQPPACSLHPEGPPA